MVHGSALVFCERCWPIGAEVLSPRPAPRLCGPPGVQNPCEASCCSWGSGHQPMASFGGTIAGKDLHGGTLKALKAAGFSIPGRENSWKSWGKITKRPRKTFLSFRGLITGEMALASQPSECSGSHLPGLRTSLHCYCNE